MHFRNQENQDLVKVSRTGLGKKVLGNPKAPTSGHGASKGRRSLFYFYNCPFCRAPQAHLPGLLSEFRHWPSPAWSPCWQDRPPQLSPFISSCLLDSPFTLPLPRRWEKEQTQRQAWALSKISLGDGGFWKLSPVRGLQNSFLWMPSVKEDTARNCDSSNFQTQAQNAQTQPRKTGFPPSGQSVLPASDTKGDRAEWPASPPTAWLPFLLFRVL